MTPQRAKELLPVIQAFAEGREIQYRDKAYSNYDSWIDVSGDPSWELPVNDNYEYRIKPSPREFWLVRRHERDIQQIWTMSPAGSGCCHEIIHVREVVNE